MNLKKINIIGILFILLISFVTHNMYDWCPCKINALLFPVNESIWEHFKMIFTSTLIWGIVAYILLKCYDMDYQNLISAIVMSALINILLVFIIYTPIYLIFGENFIVTIIIYIITIIASEVFAYYILKHNCNLCLLNKISILLIPAVYIIFGILTYHPPKIEFLFYDKSNNRYGINNVYELDD
jgi:hypothetical protein